MGDYLLRRSSARLRRRYTVLMDRSKQGKKEFPAQIKTRDRLIIETVRENQERAAILLLHIVNENYASARALLSKFYITERDLLIRPGGILTDKQIELLRGE